MPFPERHLRDGKILITTNSEERQLSYFSKLVLTSLKYDCKLNNKILSHMERLWAPMSNLKYDTYFTLKLKPDALSCWLFNVKLYVTRIFSIRIHLFFTGYSSCRLLSTAFSISSFWPNCANIWFTNTYVGVFHSGARSQSSWHLVPFPHCSRCNFAWLININGTVPGCSALLPPAEINQILRDQVAFNNTENYC